MDDIDVAVKKLKGALAISEWHFRDAVEDLMEQCRQEGEENYEDISGE